MTGTRQGVYIWVTWLSKLMAGEMGCWWSAWFKAHYVGYDKVPSDFNLAKWTAEHTRIVHEVVTERESIGELVTVEDQNSFRYRFGDGVTIAGKPDIVSITDNTLSVIDVKTGQPRVSDHMQVMLYLLLLPRVRVKCEARSLEGHVVYREYRSDILSQAIDEGFKRNARYFLNLLNSEESAKKVPSIGNCRFCDVGRSDCPERVDEDKGNGGWDSLTEDVGLF